jgi:hypothetical protein
MTRKSRRILTGMVVALAAVFVPAAGAQLPTVDAQSLSTPTLSTPSVQVPSLEVPQTPLQTPQVQAPSVQLPPVQTPQLQPPSVPGVNTPSAPGAGSAPSIGGAPGATAPAGGGGAASGFGLAAGGSPNAAGGALAGGSPRQQRASARRAERRRRAAREARLRKSARRLRGCLGALPRFVRRVVVMRAGIGGAPRTRRQVARRLDVSVGRVRHAERSGLGRLRRADSELGCGRLGDTAGSTGSGVGLAVWSVGTSEPDLLTARLAGNPFGAAEDRSGVAGETRSSDDSGGVDPGNGVRQVAGADSAGNGVRQVAGADSVATNLILVALLALSVIALMAVDPLEEMGRRRGRHR